MINAKTTKAIINVSTHSPQTYYKSIGEFFTALEWGLRENDLQFADEFYPQIHTNSGRGALAIATLGEIGIELFCVLYTWYRMSSGNWEFICYPSC